MMTITFSMLKWGAIAGTISGLLWASLMEVAGSIYFKLSYTQMLDYYNWVLASNSNTLSGMTAAEYLSQRLEVSTINTFVFGPAAGALLGFLLAWLCPKFLKNKSYITKGVIIALLLAVIYEATVPVFAPFIFASSLTITVFSGFTWGSLYQRLTQPHPKKGQELHSPQM